MRRQISGKPDGSNPLIYTGSVPNMVTMPRRPTVQDGLNWPLGFWWLIPKDSTFTTGEIWILVSVANAIAIWKKLHGGGGPTPPSSIATVNKIFLTTPGAGTYTPTAGMSECYVECVGGGGGGDYIENTGYQNFPGAGGGAYSAKLYTAAEIGTSQSYVIGAAGAAGPGYPTHATAGGNTTFGSGSTLITAGGGQPNFCDTLNPPVFGAGGTATGGDINLSGEDGAEISGLYPASAAYTSGKGGNSPMGYGFGGRAINSTSNGNTGTGYGGGAGGAWWVLNPSPSAGVNGSPGIIVITEYIG